MSQQEIRFKLGLDGADQVQSGAASVAGALGKLGTAQGAAAASTQQSAHHTAQLSAQLQDLFVQIQAGGSPLTALIQQGSQLSAVFGGFGPALRAVGSLITPTVVGLGAAAAAIGSVGLAFVQGSRESKAFADALALTGNAAGVTEGRVNAMALSIGERTLAGVGTAREALQSLVASGRVSGAAIEATAGAVAALSRATGETTDDIAKRFAGMTDDVAGGARKLADQFNFLSGAQYAHIKALQESGREQQALAETMALLESHIGTTTKNLGTLERAWVTATVEAGKYWDTIKGIGRETTVEDSIAGLQQKSARLRAAASNTGVANVGEFVASLGGKSFSEQADEVDRLVVRLRTTKELSEAVAKASGESAERHKAARQWIEDGSKYLSRQLQYEREIKQTKELAAKAGIAADDEKLAQRLAAIAEKYKDLGAAARKSADEQRKAIEAGVKLADDLVAQTSGLAPDFAEKWASLSVAFKAGAIGVDQLEAAQRKLLAQQPAMKAAADEQERSMAAFLKAAQAEADAMDDLQRKREADADRSLESAIGRVRALEDESAAVELSMAVNISLAEAVERVALARLREKLAIEESIGASASVINAMRAEIETRERLIAAVSGKSAREASDKAAKEAAAVWDRTFQDVGELMFEAFTGNWDRVKKHIQREAIRAIIMPELRGLQTALTESVLGQRGKSTPGLRDLFSPGSILGSSEVGVEVFGHDLMLKDVLQGASYIDAFMQAKAGKWGTAIGEGVGAYFGGPAGAMIGKLIGSAVDKVFSGGAGTPHIGGYVLADASGRVSDITAAQGGTLQADTQQAVGLLAQQLVRALNAGSTAFGGAGGISARAVFEADGQDGSWALFHLLNDKGVKLSGSFDALGTLAADPQAGFDQFAGQATRAVRDALLAIDLPKWASDALSKIADSDGADVLTQTVQAIVQAQQAISGFTETFESLGGLFARVAGLSSDAIQALATSSGGLDALAGNLQGYFQAFYTEGERSAMVLASIGATLADVGLQVPATREAFRALVDSQDLTTEAGQRALAALLGVSSAFDQVSDSAEQAAAAVGSRRDALTIELLRAQGNESAAVALQRQAELTALRALDPALADLQQTIYDTADAATAAALALQISDRRGSLEIALLRAQGNETEAVRREREGELSALAKLDPALADLQRAIYSVSDAAADAASNAAKVEQLFSGLDAIIGDFLAGNDLAQYRAGRVQTTLAGGGINVSIDQIMGSTRDDLRELWQAVGVEGRLAIEAAYGAWTQLQETLTNSRIEDVIAGIATSADDLVAAYREISPAADGLVAAWRKNKTEMEALRDVLAEIAGTKPRTAVEQLRDTIGRRDSLRGVLDQNEDTRLGILAGRGDQSSVDALRAQQAALLARFTSTQDPEVARALTRATLDRIRLEGAIQQKALQGQFDEKYRLELEAYNLAKQTDTLLSQQQRAQRDALQEQITGAQRLRDLARSIPEFLGGLRAGNLSNLSFGGRLDQQRRLFESALVSGKDPQGQLTAYLQQAQAMFGGATKEYSALFEAALAQYEQAITSGAAGADGTISEAQAQLNAINKLVDDAAPKLQEAIVDTSQAQIDALSMVNASIGGVVDGLDVSIAAQTLALTAKLDEMIAHNDAMELRIQDLGAQVIAIRDAAINTATDTHRVAEAMDLAAGAPPA